MFVRVLNQVIAPLDPVSDASVEVYTIGNDMIPARVHRFPKVITLCSLHLFKQKGSKEQYDASKVVEIPCCPMRIACFLWSGCLNGQYPTVSVVTDPHSDERPKRDYAVLEPGQSVPDTRHWYRL